MRTLALCLLFFAAVTCVNSLVIRDSVNGNKPGYFIGRFVYTNGRNDSRDGMWVTYQAHAFGPFTYWALYFDTFWYSVYHNSSLTCMQKAARASIAWPIRATNHTRFHNITEFTSIHDYMRPHAWYLVLLNCPVESQTGSVSPQVNIVYTAKFINIDGSQVGYDEVGLVGIYGVFFTFFLVMSIVHGVGDFFLYLRNSFHHIVKLLLISLVVMVFSTMFSLIHWGKYGADGVGCNGCATFGSLLDDISYIFFTVLLLMIASGWAITYQTLTRKFVILGLFIANAVIVVILYIIAAASNSDDKAATVATAYAYSTATGVSTVIFGIVYFLVWGATVAYFVFSVWTSYRDEAQFDKRVFYMVFGVAYLAWFIIVPLFSLISLGIDSWLRLRMMAAIHQVITFVGYGVLVVLLWPSFVYKYFRVISPDLLTDNPGGL